MNPANQALLGLPEPPKATIASRYAVCATAFSRATHLWSPNTSHGITDRLSTTALQDEYGRFRVWSGNIGAHRVGKVSLDHRLREASLMYKRVTDLLDELRSNLDELSDILSGKRTPYDEQSSDSSNSGSESENGTAGDESAEDASHVSRTEIEQRLFDINDIIGCLYRLSVSFRNPAPTDRLAKSAQIDVSHFTQWDVRHVSEKFPLAATSIIQRLGEANTKRRQLLRYMEKHHSKLSRNLLALPAKDEKPAGAPAADLSGLPPTLTIQAEEDAAEKEAQSQPATVRTTPSALATTVNTQTTVATFLEKENEADMEDALSETSSATSSSIGDDGALRLPPPPKGALDGEPFECPYCYDMTNVRSMLSWKKHVFRDLQPYLCTFVECSRPNRIFASRHMWTNHENQAHRRQWVCSTCQYTASTRFELENHLIQSHEGAVGAHQLDTLIDICERPIPAGTPQICPLCLQENQTLNSHLARHLQNLALFTLPRKDSVSENDVASNDARVWNSDDEEDEEQRMEGVGDVESVSDISSTIFKVIPDVVDDGPVSSKDASAPAAMDEDTQLADENKSDDFLDETQQEHDARIASESTPRGIAIAPALDDWATFSAPPDVAGHPEGKDEDNAQQTDVKDVEIIVPPSVSSTEPADLKTRRPLSQPFVYHVQAIYDFIPTEAGELEFAEGDIIRIVESIYKDWWKGILNGQTGIIPVNYVRKLEGMISPNISKTLEGEVDSKSVLMRNLERLQLILEYNAYIKDINSKLDHRFELGDDGAAIRNQEHDWWVSLKPYLQNLQEAGLHLAAVRTKPGFVPYPIQSQLSSLRVVPPEPRSKLSLDFKEQTALDSHIFDRLIDTPKDAIPHMNEQQIELDLERHRLVPRDEEGALKWAEKALPWVELARQQHQRSQEKANRSPTSLPNALIMIETDACNIVNFHAQMHVSMALFLKGLSFEFGKVGHRIDKQLAGRYYRLAAVKGYARAEYRCGMMLESSDGFPAAIQYYQAGVGRRDSAALYRLAMMKMLGQHGQERDMQGGLEMLFRSADSADLNSPQGAYVLGMLLIGELRDQIYIPVDYFPLNIEVGKGHIRKAAELGFAKAIYRLGQFYEFAEHGMEFDPARSLHYYHYAALFGESEAEMGVSKWFLAGAEGVFEKNETIAYEYASRAAASGLANAIFALGYFCEVGIHVNIDLEQAKTWYRKAAEQGHDDAIKRLRALAIDSDEYLEEYANTTGYPDTGELLAMPDADYDRLNYGARRDAAYEIRDTLARSDDQKAGKTDDVLYREYTSDTQHLASDNTEEPSATESKIAESRTHLPPTAITPSSTSNTTTGATTATVKLPTKASNRRKLRNIFSRSKS